MSEEQIIKLWFEAGFRTIPHGVAMEKLLRFVQLVRGAA